MTPERWRQINELFHEVIGLDAAGRDELLAKTAQTDAELAAADEYERPALYRRVEVTLASGRQAWVYVHTPPSSPRS